MPQKLLLVNSNISDTNILEDSCLPNVAFLLYDYNIDTFDTLLQKIRNLGFSTFDEVGFIFHGYSAFTPTFKLLNSQSYESYVDNLSPNMSTDVVLDTWREIIDFLKYLTLNFATQTVDFFACNFYSNPNWKFILNTLEEHLSIHIRASSDTTGNMENGGNWIMESDNTNIQSIYFNENIINYKFTFAVASGYKFTHTDGNTYDLFDWFSSTTPGTLTTGFKSTSNNNTDLGSIFAKQSIINGYDNGYPITTKYTYTDTNTGSSIDLGTRFARNELILSSQSNTSVSCIAVNDYNRLLYFKIASIQGYSSSIVIKFTREVNAQILLVAGGGGGGDCNGGLPGYPMGGGGGGAGECCIGSLVFKKNTEYTLGIGTGGVTNRYNWSQTGSSPGDNSFIQDTVANTSLIAAGGGAGGGKGDIDGSTGGSNGGIMWLHGTPPAPADTVKSTVNTIGATITRNGNKSGAATQYNFLVGPYTSGLGGGGAGGQGKSPDPRHLVGGGGGIGLTWAIDSKKYGGGGAGGMGYNKIGAGEDGVTWGGGKGAITTVFTTGGTTYKQRNETTCNAQDDTGGGGGGGGHDGTGQYVYGGNGGSGIIAIAFNML